MPADDEFGSEVATAANKESEIILKNNVQRDLLPFYIIISSTVYIEKLENSSLV